MKPNLNYSELSDAIQYVSERILSAYGHAYISSPHVSETVQSQGWMTPKATGLYWKLMRNVNAIPVDILRIIKGDFLFIFYDYNVDPGEPGERSETYAIQYEIYYKNQLLNF